MNNTFDPQILIDMAIKVQNMSSCDVEAFGFCKLPSQIEELLGAMGVDYTIIPNKYYSKDFEENIYIMPKRKTKIKYWREFFNED